MSSRASDDASPTGAPGAPNHHHVALLDHGSLAPAAADPSAPFLEEELAAHVASLDATRALDRRRQAAILDRLGLRGRPPLTLAEAGRRAGLSGERVRQIEARLRKVQQERGPGEPPQLPQLDAALGTVAQATPLPAADVGGLLVQAGVSAQPFSAASLRSAAELLGRALPFVVSGTGSDAVLLPEVASEAVANRRLIETRARRQVERSGAGRLAGLRRELAEAGVEVAVHHLRVVLDTLGAEIRRGGWFWFPDPRGTGAFSRASRRMLAVTSPLSVSSLHDGLSRHNSFRRLPAPPPPAVLAQVYAEHPAFAVTRGRVRCVEPADPGLVGPLNERIVEILRAAPGGVLTRSRLLDACHQAGLNLTSVNLYATYSECLERMGAGRFAVRGTVVDPGAAPAGPRRREEPAVVRRPTSGRTTDGRPWMRGRVTPNTWANGVVHVPASLCAELAGRHFQCTDDSGTVVTTLGVDRHGNSWGWTRFLRLAGAKPGDAVRATFDPAAGTARVELEPAGEVDEAS